MTRIAIIDGHPDPKREHFDHAISDAYANGGAEEGHAVRRINVAELDFPMLRSMAEWQTSPVTPDIAAAQETIKWAEHLVFIYPLWLGDMPGILKAFLEQVARPEFAFRYGEGLPEKLLKGRSARIIVTMGMPAFYYRLVYRAHSVKSFERNILNFVGIKPVRTTILGGVEGAEHKRAQWLEEMTDLGRAAS